MKGTWQTTDSGGSGAVAAALVIGAAVLAAAIAGPVIAAVAELVRLVLIAGAVILGLALAGGAAYGAHRVRQGRRSAPLRVRQVPPVTWRAAQAVQEPRRPAIEAPREVHLHFHGADAEQVAEVLRQLPHEPIL
jgi:hypothetical protein